MMTGLHYDDRYVEPPFGSCLRLGFNARGLELQFRRSYSDQSLV